MNISVIVPVYNVETYLEECMSSLLNQTFKPYEIILVDDGSTDSSGSICDRYSSSYNYIKTVHKKNAGLGFARNTGLENASGDWVVFLDSDDVFGKRLLEVLATAQNKYSADLVAGGYERIDANKNIVPGVKYCETIYDQNGIQKDLIPRLIGSSPNKSDSISMSVCNALYSMRIIRNKGIRFPSERKVISEDLFFNFDYYIYANKVVLVSDTEYKYRITMGSLTKKYRENRFYLSKNLYYEMANRIANYNLEEECTYRLMRSMFNYWRMCFSQEKKKISGKTNKEQRKSISNLCKDELTITMLSQYPISMLGIKQKIFLYLVKYNMKEVIRLVVEYTSFL